MRSTWGRRCERRYALPGWVCGRHGCHRLPGHHGRPECGDHARGRGCPRHGHARPHACGDAHSRFARPRTNAQRCGLPNDGSNHRPDQEPAASPAAYEHGRRDLWWWFRFGAETACIDAYSGHRVHSPGRPHPDRDRAFEPASACRGRLARAYPDARAGLANTHPGSGNRMVGPAHASAASAAAR